MLGPKRLPELAKALGDGIREFRESVSEGAEHDSPHAHGPAAAQPATVVQSVAPAPPAAQASPGEEPTAE